MLIPSFGGITAQPTQAALTKVYFAAQNIPQGTKITQEMLGTFSIPPENVAEVMFTVGEEGSLVGQTARFILDQGVIDYLFDGGYWSGGNLRARLGCSDPLRYGRGSDSDESPCPGRLWRQ